MTKRRIATSWEQQVLAKVCSQILSLCSSIYQMNTRHARCQRRVLHPAESGRCLGFSALNSRVQGVTPGSSIFPREARVGFPSSPTCWEFSPCFLSMSAKTKLLNLHFGQQLHLSLEMSPVDMVVVLAGRWELAHCLVCPQPGDGHSNAQEA